MIRGVPGSTKTTRARQLALELGITDYYEADMFFMMGGVYRWSASRLKDAHTWCQNKTKDALLNGKSVIVANCFVRKWEMKFYLDLAQELGIKVVVEVMEGKYDNVHGVPQDKIEQMRKNFEY